LSEYRAAGPAASQERHQVNLSQIAAVNRMTLLKQGDLIVAGYIQDYIERRANKIAAKMGTVGQRLLGRLLEEHLSQLTIVTTEFKSYTVLADLQNTVVTRKDMVLARIRAIRAVGIREVPAIFLADEVKLIRGGSHA
jgi:hypothetical protein